MQSRNPVSNTAPLYPPEKQATRAVSGHEERAVPEKGAFDYNETHRVGQVQQPESFLDTLSEEALLIALKAKQERKQMQAATIALTDATAQGPIPSESYQADAPPDVASALPGPVAIARPAVMANVRGFKAKGVKFGQGALSAIGNHQIVVRQVAGVPAPDLAGVAKMPMVAAAPAVLEGAADIELEGGEFEGGAAIAGNQVLYK